MISIWTAKPMSSALTPTQASGLHCQLSSAHNHIDDCQALPIPKSLFSNLPALWNHLQRLQKYLCPGYTARYSYELDIKVTVPCFENCSTSKCVQPRLMLIPFAHAQFLRVIIDSFLSPPFPRYQILIFLLP